MSKPPAHVDPEKFIIGEGLYSNIVPARPYADERVVRIDPAPPPVRPLIVINLVFILFFYGFHWVAMRCAQGETRVLAAYIAPIGIGLLTCGVFTAMTVFTFCKALRLGPWLVYDKTSKQVSLPREGETFDRSQIVHLQYITTRRLHSSGSDAEKLSELNLITCRDGTRMRWPLLRSISSGNPFDCMLKPLVENSDLPVVRVTGSLSGWEVTEIPWP